MIKIRVYLNKNKKNEYKYLYRKNSFLYEKL